MGLSPSKPPSLTENFPHNPAISEAKIWFVFRKWRGYGGSFLCLGRWSFFAECGCRACFAGGKREMIGSKDRVYGVIEPEIYDTLMDNILKEIKRVTR